MAWNFYGRWSQAIEQINHKLLVSKSCKLFIYRMLCNEMCHLFQNQRMCECAKAAPGTENIHINIFVENVENVLLS